MLCLEVLLRVLPDEGTIHCERISLGADSNRVTLNHDLKFVALLR